MTILVDEAIWAWRGHRWAHLISDHSHQELHDFATGIGKKRVSFQGDHYDVRADERVAALEAGAKAVTSRQVIRALRAAGLRRRPSEARIDWQFDIRATVRDLAGLADLLREFAKEPGADAVVKAAASVGSRARLQPGRIEVTTLRGSRDLALIVSAPSLLWHAPPDISGLNVHEAYVSETANMTTIELLTGPGTARSTVSPLPGTQPLPAP